MKLENQTPFSTVWMPGRLRYPAYSLTVIVKATFKLCDDGRIVEATEQLPVGPDIEEGGDGGAVRYDMDLVEFKPLADRLLVGQCYAPGGRPTAECTVGFTVGTWKRQLRVVGDRVWKRGLLSTKADDPRPFTEMELTYSRAYGGPRFAPNPAGRGFHKGKPESDRDLFLPNIEDPLLPVKSPTDLVAPAGFGPIARTWAPRRNLIGTYGKPWFRTRCPWYPEDMDWRVHNATPVTGQVDGYLQGDEPLVLENLFPDRPRWEGRLPGIRVRALVERHRQSGVSEEEVVLELDTLWIDTKASLVVLVWRGSCPVASEEYEDLSRLTILREALAGPKATVHQLFAGLSERNAVEETADEELEESDGTEPAPEEEGVEAGPSPEDDAAERRALIDAVRKSLERVPSGSDALPEQLEARAEIERTIALLEAPPVAPNRGATTVPWSRERVLETVLAIAGQETESAGSAPDASLGADSHAVSGAEPWVDPEALAHANLSGLDLSGVDFRGVTLTGTRLDSARLESAVLDGCDLDDASLAGVEAGRASFVGATFRGANLREAKLVDAVLTDVDLFDATLSGADLTGVALTDSDLKECRLEGVILDRVDASGANFTGANLDGARGKGCRFTEAVLDATALGGASFEAAYFSKASIEGASARGLVLSQCDLNEASFAKSDLSAARILSSRADGASFIGANLDGADLTESDLNGSDFSRASLEGTKFLAAGLRGANFRRCRALRASFANADLFQSLFPAAQLLDVDFQGANLYGSDLSDMEARGLRIEGALVGQTRLDVS